MNPDPSTHRPVLGPLYWSRRCRISGHPMAHHPGPLRRWLNRRRTRRHSASS